MQERAHTARVHPPIYRGGDRTYHVDTCRPQKEARQARKIDLHALARGTYPGERLPNDALRGLNSLGFWDAVGPQDWGLELHRNEGVEIALMETGGMPFVLEDRTHDLRAGDLTITRPWQLHSHGHPFIGPGRIHWAVIDVGVRRPNQDWKWPSWVILSPGDLRELTSRLRHNERPAWKATNELIECFRAIARTLTSGAGARRISPLTVYLNEVLWHILELLRRDRRRGEPELLSSQRTVELFLRDLENNPGGLAHDWTLGGMAAECGLGVTAFSRYFRLLTNTSPLNHLNRLRLHHAARLLCERPDTSITAIAMACGFNSSQYFATQFHRHFGHPPKAHRCGKA